MTKPVCLDCDRPLLIAATLNIGDTFSCRHCQSELELVSIKPLKVDWPHDDTYDDWDGEVDDYHDSWLDDEWDEDEWDEDEDYSWMLSKQKRHQESDEPERKRIRGNV